MTVELYAMDGVTRIVALIVPRVDDAPKVATWHGRTFLLTSAVRVAGKATLSYLETFPFRLEFPE